MDVFITEIYADRLSFDFTWPGRTEDGGEVGRGRGFPESATPRTLRSRGCVESGTRTAGA